MKEIILIAVNGTDYELAVDHHRTLVEVLREDLNLTGTKLGCGSGSCGACSVSVDGKIVNSCLTLAPEIDGKEIMTVEGLQESEEELHPIQEAFVEKGAIQCGFCTPGMEMSAHNLLQNNPDPTREEIKEGISGNLCRCTGYYKIIDAIHAAAEK